MSNDIEYKYEILDVNSCLNIAKFFAIISVIMAHSRNTDYYFFSNVTERIGAIGVVAFLIIAGYYFNVEKYGIRNFFKNKVTTIIVPWIFTSTVVYFVSKKWSNLLFTDWLQWIVGYGTYLYYLSILMFCYVILSFFNNRFYLILFIFLNIISQLLTSFGVFDDFFLKYFNLININNYLNILNWIGYFTLGILLKGNLKIIMVFLKKYCLLTVFIYFVALLVSFIVEPNYAGYFSKLAIPMQLLGVSAILSISTIKKLNINLINKIAELTFAIYLTHFLIFPIRKFLLTGVLFEFINPFVILAVNCLVLLLGIYISEKTKLNGLYSLLLGIRKSKNFKK